MSLLMTIIERAGFTRFAPRGDVAVVDGVGGDVTAVVTVGGDVALL